MNPNQKLTNDQSELLDDPGRYRRLVEKLNYIATIWPDISFAPSLVSQFLEKPKSISLGCSTRNSQVFERMTGCGILYKAQGHLYIEGYIDADWANSPFDRRSTTGYVHFLEEILVTWKSKKQVVVRSSAEVEYRAMSHTSCKLIWLRNFLQEMGSKVEKPMKIF